nr:ATP-dependent DNA helicase PIF1-like [Coffea arabica]
MSEISVKVIENDISAISLLNKEQKAAFNLIIEAVFVKSKGCFFVDGSGGTGKTFLYRALLAEVRSKGYIALATASCGVAAAILLGGRTAHSRFKIPLDMNPNKMCKVSKQSSLVKLLQRAKLIIWDEAPMTHKARIEGVDKLFRDLMDSSEIFGSKVIIFGEDFRQVLPVVFRGSKADFVQSSLTISYIWPELQKIQLKEIMRAKSDPNFTEYLLRIGNGTELVIYDENVEIPAKMLIRYTTEEESLTALINTVCDTCFDPSQQAILEDFINSLMPNGLPPHRLTLKQNTPIMLLRNIDPPEGLCNGTRLLCRSLKSNVIDAIISSGEFSGKQVFLHRICFRVEDDPNYPISSERIQFPVRLCFAMTINKAQGQTLNFVGIYLCEPVFSHGQLYVAISRAKNSNFVKILIRPPIHDITLDNLTANIVYQEVLHLANA